MSASPLLSSPSLSWSATRFAASTGLPDGDVLDAGRADQRRQLIGDGADEADTLTAR